jgi:hypothetical protein
MGERPKEALRVRFGKRLRLEFQGARTTMDNSRLTASGYTLSAMGVARFLMGHPSWAGYFLEWQRSLRMKQKYPSASTLTMNIPWLTYGAIGWLNKYLRPDMKVFEYGSGGSTIYIARRVKELVSVEHSSEWFGRVSRVIQQRRISNSTIILAEPDERGDRLDEKYSSTTFPEYRGYSFEKYVRTVNSYPDNYFDLIIVDGRSRTACVMESAAKIKNGGYLLLDNSEREQYEEAFVFMQRYSRKDFFGFGPLLKTVWNTTIWKITRPA